MSPLMWSLIAVFTFALLLISVQCLIVRSNRKKQEKIRALSKAQASSDNIIRAAQEYFRERRAKPGDVIFFRAPDNSTHQDVVLVICETPEEGIHLVSDGVVSRTWYSRFFSQTHLDRMRIIRRDDATRPNQEELITCCLILAEQIKRSAKDVLGSPLAQESAYWDTE